MHRQAGDRRKLLLGEPAASRSALSCAPNGLETACGISIPFYCRVRSVVRAAYGRCRCQRAGRADHTGHMADATSAATETFEAVVMPHLHAAYRLARWLVKNDARCRRCRAGCRGAGLALFHVVCRRKRARLVSPDLDATRAMDVSWPTADDEATSSMRRTAQRRVARASGPRDAAPSSRLFRARRADDLQPPERFRELLALRELEELSYRELAEVLDIPIGSVMSGLSRARQAFRAALEHQMDRESRAEAGDPQRCLV